MRLILVATWMPWPGPEDAVAVRKLLAALAVLLIVSKQFVIDVRLPN
jgi:hypothetical protein